VAPGRALSRRLFRERDHVANPAGAFARRARGGPRQGGKGRPRSLQVLVYDPGDASSSGVAADVDRPEAATRGRLDDDEWDDDGGDKVRHALRGRISLRDLEKARSAR
jgi:hypothetical protein